MKGFSLVINEKNNKEKQGIKRLNLIKIINTNNVNIDVINILCILLYKKL